LGVREAPAMPRELRSTSGDSYRDRRC
jgi:hypothetical protein